MKRKKICFIAQFPPPIHGLSKAVDTLYNSRLCSDYTFEKINITNNSLFLINLVLIMKSRSTLYYITISQTKWGNIRDMIILKLLNIMHKQYLIHLHGGYYRALIDNDLGKLQKKINYNLINKANGVIVLGPSLKHIFTKMIPYDKIYTVPNCVDDQYFMSDIEFQEKLRNIKEKKTKHVLFLSNFIKSKGYVEVLELAKMEKQRVEAGNIKKLHFDFAGKFFDKTEEDFFYLFIEKNQLDTFITYHGVVDGEQKRKLLKNCDLFILLTRYPNEGQPISILEAMANGLFVISTDHAGIPDIINSKLNGILLKENEALELRIIFELLYSDNDMMLIRNRDLVKINYNENKYVNNMLKVFKTTLN